MRIRQIHILALKWHAILQNMKKMKTVWVISIISFSLLAGTVEHSRKVWTLNDCIRFAMQNNISVQKVEVEARLASEDLQQSKRNLLPSVGISSGAGYSFGRSIDPNTNLIVNNQFFNSNFQVGASMPVSGGFLMIRQIEYQKFRQKAAELNRLSVMDDLAFQVMGAYFEVMYYEGLLKIAGQQVETSALNLKKVVKQVGLGMKSMTDLYDMRANYEAEELRRIQTENRLTSVNLELKQLMNLTDTARLMLKKDSLAEMTPAIPDGQLMVSYFLDWSPVVQSFATQLKLSKKQLSISRSMLYPSVNLNGSVGSGFYETNKDNAGRTIGFRSQFNNNLNQFFGASVSVPVFYRWSRRSDISKAKMQVEQAQNRLDEQKQKAYFEIENSRNEMVAFEKEHSQYKKQMEADRLAFQAAEKKLEQGMISVADFYIAKNRLAQTESQVLASRLQWEIRKKALDFYMGKRFWEE